MVPRSLFNCLTLIKLSLEFCVLKIPRRFKTFSTLTTISFTCVVFPGNSRLEALIRQCPLLRSLTLEYCDGCDELEIITPTLCYFRVVGFLPDLRFNTPMLDFLDLCLRSWHYEFVEEQYGCIDLLGGLPNLQNIQLSEFLLEFLSVSIALNSVKVFRKLKFLNIYKCDCLKEPKTLLWLLRSSPVLESLYINNKMNNSSEIPVPEFRKVDGNLDFNFNSLKKLKIKRLCVAAIRFIEFVLRNAPSLEEVHIDHGSDIPDGVLIHCYLFPGLLQRQEYSTRTHGASLDFP